MGYSSPFIFIVKAKSDNEAVKKVFANLRTGGEDIDLYDPLQSDYPVHWGLDKVAVFRADTQGAQTTIECYKQHNCFGEYMPNEILNDKEHKEIQLDDPKLKSSEYFIVPALLYH
jgi:hypothetical protein